MTRREAIVLGAAAGAAASVGLPALAPADVVIGPGSDGPSFLVRATYEGLVGEPFRVGSHALRLVAVRDVDGAAADPSLRGHQDAFALEFEGQADAFELDTHEMHHDLVGPFPIFVGPVGAVRGTAQTYEVTVDRSVRIRLADAPQPGETVLRPAEVVLEADRPANDGEARAKAPAPAPRSERDQAVIDERLAAAAAPIVARRVNARRAHRKLRAAHDARFRFKRKQRARVRRTRSGWLRRHGR
ncbi:MAG TPA: hypothetical protein VF529_04360 [Solirubrobacteraceae bacterium]|jgi:hypothetical protein